MATKGQFFPASIVDETAYFMEGAINTTLTYGWTLTLKGEVDSEIIRQAVLSTFHRYPKYKCILVKDYPSFKRWFRYCWLYRDTVNTEDIFREVVTTDADPGKDAVFYFRELYTSNRIDVTRHTQLKIILIRKPESVILIFFHNHILSDGRGLLGLIKRFIQEYEGIFYHRTKEDLIPDFASIPLPEIGPPWRELSLRHLGIIVKKSRLFLLEPAVAVHHNGGEKSPGGLPLATRVLSPDQLGMLKSSARKYQVTVNDYLIAIMLQTIKKWNKERGGRSGRFYISVPVSLRSAEDCTASNSLGGYIISPDPQTLSDKRALMHQVQEQRTFLHESKAGRIDPSFAWPLKFIPIAVKTFLFKHHTRASYPSLCLSNIGVCDYNPSHTDQQGFHYMGPARITGSNVVTAAIPWPQVVIHTYNNRMGFSLSAFRSHFALETAQMFLDNYIQELLGETS